MKRPRGVPFSKSPRPPPILVQRHGDTFFFCRPDVEQPCGAKSIRRDRTSGLCVVPEYSVAPPPKRHLPRDRHASGAGDWRHGRIGAWLVAGHCT